MSQIDLSKDEFMIDRRQTIDLLDTAFLHLLAERIRVVEKIIFLKQEKQLDLGQSKKRQEDMNELLTFSIRLNLDKEFFQTILDLIFKHAIEQLPQKISDNYETMKQYSSDLNLNELRENLMNLDQSIFLILSERFRTVKTIGLHKKELGVEPLDPERWVKVLDHKIHLAREIGINPDLTQDLFNAIHKAALDIEKIID